MGNIPCPESTGEMRVTEGKETFEREGFEAFGRLTSPALGCRTYYARKRGRSHVIKGTVCQDYCIAESIDEGCALLAVADGHGGEKYERSDRGSRLACEVLYRTVKECVLANSTPTCRVSALRYLKGEAFKTCFLEAWRAAVLEDYRNEVGEYDPEKLSDVLELYGTTLIFAVVTKTRVLLGQVGDGVILMFNGGDREWVFRRHFPKLDTTTASLVSSRCKYSFLTDIVKRSDAGHILLSTDGIYDRFVRNDGSPDHELFADYARDLVLAEEEDGTVERPFHYGERDVSEVTSDDCSVVLMISEDLPTGKTVDDALKCYFGNVKLSYAYRGLRVYSATMDGKPVELQVSPRPSPARAALAELEGCNVLMPLKRFRLWDKYYISVYELPEDVIPLRMLLEANEHLEKRYDSEEPFNCQFWLAMYERICRLDHKIAASSLDVNPFLLDTAYVSEAGEIYLFSNAFRVISEKYRKKYREENGGLPVKRAVFSKGFYKYFAFLGKIVCGDKVLPLYTTESFGQPIPMLHLPEERLGYIHFNAKHRLHCLLNASSVAWHRAPDMQVVDPGREMGLSENRTFYVGGADGADPTSAVAYDVILFETKKKEEGNGNG